MNSKKTRRSCCKIIRFLSLSLETESSLELVVMCIFFSPWFVASTLDHIQTPPPTTTTSFSQAYQNRTAWIIFISETRCAWIQSVREKFIFGSRVIIQRVQKNLARLAYNQEDDWLKEMMSEGRGRKTIREANLLCLTCNKIPWKIRHSCNHREKGSSARCAKADKLSSMTPTYHC